MDKNKLIAELFEDTSEDIGDMIKDMNIKSISVTTEVEFHE